MIISTFYDHLKSAADEKNLPVETIAELCLEHGITGFEATVQQLSEEGVKRLRAAGMRLSSMPVHCDLLHEPSLEFAKQIAESAARAEAAVILVIPGNFAADDDRTALLEASLAPVEHIIDTAKADGISVGMEDFDGRMSANLGLAGLKWYLDRLPELTCVFDTGNFICAGEDTLENYKILKPFITKQVHCKDRGLAGRAGEPALDCLDGTRLYPAAAGRGIIPIKEIVSDLAESGFDGILTAEIYGSLKPWEDIAESAEYLKSIIA